MGISDTSLRKMRSEFAHRFQLDKEFRVDCDKAKFFFDFECPGFNKKSIQGYVHEVHSNPFGAILLSEFQVMRKILINDFFLKYILRLKYGLLFARGIQFGISMQLVVYSKIFRINKKH